MSRVSSIRSAAQATFSAPRQVPIRWRLAGGSALLTLVILCGFAGAVGGLTTQRLHAGLRRARSRDAADLLQARIKYDAVVSDGELGTARARRPAAAADDYCGRRRDDRADRHCATACSSTARADAGLRPADASGSSSS